MTQIIKTLVSPVASKVTYDAVMVENLTYDPVGLKYTARVYGCCRGVIIPLILSTPVTVRRIEEVTVTDEEINAVMEAKPEITNRLDAAMVRAYDRLVALANEQEV